MAQLRAGFEAELVAAIEAAADQEPNSPAPGSPAPPPLPMDTATADHLPSPSPSRSLEAAAQASQQRRSQHGAGGRMSVRAALRGRLDSDEAEAGQRVKVVTEAGFELASTML